MSLEISPYHNNTAIGLTAWNSDAQAYYLISFAEVSSFFKQVSEQIAVPESLVDAAFTFMSEYNPAEEAVLMTLNEDLLTVAVVNKYQPPTKESLAEQLDWALEKVYTFCYLEKQSKSVSLICEALDLTFDEYDQAMNLILA
jgi:hypothetical protein